MGRWFPSVMGTAVAAGKRFPWEMTAGCVMAHGRVIGRWEQENTPFPLSCAACCARSRLCSQRARCTERKRKVPLCFELAHGVLLGCSTGGHLSQEDCGRHPSKDRSQPSEVRRMPSGPYRKYVSEGERIWCLIQYLYPMDSQVLLVDRSWVRGLERGLEFPNNWWPSEFYYRLYYMCEMRVNGSPYI